MLALVIVEAEPGANASPGLGNAGINVKVKAKRAGWTENIGPSAPPS